MASDLEVLIFIPTAPHLTANRPSARWRSRPDEANRTTLSANSRDEMQCEPSSCSGRTEDRTALNRAPRTPYSQSTPPPQNATRDTVECLLQVHKTHVDWSGELPWTLEHPIEGIKLVQCPTARTKTALFLLNPRFYYRPVSPLQYSGIDFSGEAEECDSPYRWNTLSSPPS